VVDQALQKFASLVRGKFGARLRELTLFGSRARGTARPDSDVDILVVVDDLASSEARDLGYLAGDLLTEFDVLIVPFVVSTARMSLLRASQRLIATEIARDGVAL
jgi:predicted nucleotidyltransferase